jgi:hypothetical protein
VPHSTFWSFLLLHLELLSLDVLGVLGEQTLEISKGVKDSLVVDPSLAKEVRDPSLTILLSYKLLATVKKKRRCAVHEVSSRRAHFLKKLGSI